MIQKMIHGLLPQTLSAVDESKTQTRPSEYDLLDRPDGGALLNLLFTSSSRRSSR